MTLINKNPVGKISIDKNGKMTITHFSDGTLKPCIYCGELTDNRRLGMVECPSCVEFGPSKCKECEFGFRKGVFHCNGNDIDDHFTYYTACAMHDYMGKLRTEPNFEEYASAWHVSVLERKKCFEPRKTRKYKRS